ncbi:uncharacterized protein UBRO_20334 [Ustilago bromivora]|uniref:Uncharacterized protein n=1 Tax=Ustilago bromivora TaxID=307758 RepID=A0A1K0G168_9BASI|nr:uncharacterized protein UBRO_20334 [Ustilago bromivora]
MKCTASSHDLRDVVNPGWLSNTVIVDAMDASLQDLHIGVLNMKMAEAALEQRRSTAFAIMQGWQSPQAFRTCKKRPHVSSLLPARRRRQANKGN